MALVVEADESNLRTEIGCYQRAHTLASPRASRAAYHSRARTRLLQASTSRGDSQRWRLCIVDNQARGRSDGPRCGTWFEACTPIAHPKRNIALRDLERRHRSVMLVLLVLLLLVQQRWMVVMGAMISWRRPRDPSDGEVEVLERQEQQTNE